MSDQRNVNTANGLSVFCSLDLDETEEAVKTSPGCLYGYHFFNANASARYLKFYDATEAGTTVGNTTPKFTVPIAGSSAGHIAFPDGIEFETAITAAATTGLANNDTGAPSANDVILTAFYA